jgi:hypothetical protein
MLSLSKHALAPPRTGTQGTARTKPDDSLVSWSKGALEVVREGVGRKVRAGVTRLARSGKTGPDHRAGS